MVQVQAALHARDRDRGAQIRVTRHYQLLYWRSAVDNCKLAYDCAYDDRDGRGPLVVVAPRIEIVADVNERASFRRDLDRSIVC